MNWEGTRDGDAKCVFSLDNKRAVRNKSGVICVLKKVFKYTGQDERYEQELEEAKANQELIADAFNTIQICDRLPSQLLIDHEELKQAVKTGIDNLKALLSDDTIGNPKAAIQYMEQLINKIENGK